MSKPPILLLGSYGRGNIGDDVFLIVAMELFPDRQIYINSADDSLLPTSAEGKVKTISTNGYNDIRAKIRLILSIKTIVYWGGDVWVKWYDSPWPSRPLYQMLVLNTVAKLLGKKVAYIGCGIGNLKSYSLLLAKITARLADVVVVRELRTAAILGIPGTMVLPDMASALPFNQAKLKNDYMRNKKFRIAVSILYHIPEPSILFPKLIKDLANAIKILPHNRYEFLLVPMLSSSDGIHDDVWASSQLLNAVGGLPNVSVVTVNSTQMAVELFRECQLVVGVRLHANVLATFNATPCIGIAYRPKVRSFFKDQNIEKYCIDLDQTTQLPQLIMKIRDDYNKVAGEFKVVAERNRSAKDKYHKITDKLN